MPYCLSCGRLRETSGGFCRQCSIDDQVRRQSRAKYEHARLMQGIKKAAAAERRVRPQGVDDIAQEENMS